MNDSFETNIQQWVSTDNQLKILNDRVRELRVKRNNLEESITQYAKTNQLTNSTIRISDGKLKFVNTRTTTPLTFKYLEKSLGDMIKNPEQVRHIVEHVKDNREIKSTTEIRRIANA